MEKPYSRVGKIIRLTLVDIAAFLSGKRLMSYYTKRNGIPENKVNKTYIPKESLDVSLR